MQDVSPFIFKRTMKVCLISAALCLLLCISLTSASYRRICYFTNWAQYRPGAGSFKPNDIDPSLCSHIHYAFAVISGNSMISSDASDLPSNGGEGMYKEVINLKKVNPSLKVLLSVGGYSVGNGPFSAIASSPSNRKAFNAQAISYLRKYEFDGLDIDWEYPESNDKSNFATWAKELREAFDKEGSTNSKGTLILACAVAANKDHVDSGYDVKTLAQAMDYITVMSYDIHGSWDKSVGQNAPLHATDHETEYSSRQNVEWAMKYWVSEGASKEKLNVGLAAYGRCFTLTSAADSQPGSPSSGPSPPGKYTGEGGFLAYYEICAKKTPNNYHWMTQAEVPYLVEGSTWIGYDDPKSLKLKVKWLKANGFRGIAVWSLDMDDFTNICTHGKYPLLNAINDELSST